MKPSTKSLCLAALFVLFTSCRSAFGDAMERGDQMASLGRWDEAAAAYEQAASIDPGDEEAQQKFLNAKRRQAAARVKKGNDLLAAGKAKEALVPFSEAVRLDPTSTEAKEGLERAKAEVVTMAEAALSAGEFKRAFELARAVLLVEPGHGKALDLESRARAEVTRAAMERGLAHEKGGATAEALLAYAEAREYTRDHADAAASVTRLRALLREEVTFFVALKNFDGDASAGGLGDDVNASVLAQGLDAKLPLRVIDRLDNKKGGKTLQGMRLGGMFQDYKHNRQKSQSSRTCDYVCGKEWIDNPQYATAEAEMRASQSAFSSAEGRVASAKASIAPAEQAKTSAEARLNQRKLDADRAEQDLSSCKSSAGSQSGACSAEQQRRDRALQDRSVAEQEFRSAEQALASAKSELSSAESDLSSKRMEADARKSTFQNTPAKVERDKICAHTYAVDTVVVTGEVSVALRGESLYSTDSMLNRGVTGRLQRSDETFPPQPGRCAEVANGDPLIVPSETESKKLVLAAAILETQRELLAAFDRYRADYMTRGETALADNKPKDGIDNLTRFLMSGGRGGAPGASSEPESDEEKRAARALGSAASVSDKAVRIAAYGDHP